MPDDLMRHGAIALIDILGFRGIWKRYPPENVVASLNGLLETTTIEARKYEKDKPDILISFVKPLFISDTIAFGLETKSVEKANAGMVECGLSDLVTFDEELLAGEAVRLTAALVGSLMRRAIAGPVPFAFRGAIAFGRFGMTDRFLIGEAVDEAASYMNAAQAAIVALTPSAAAYKQAEAPARTISNLVQYAVPLKQRSEDKPPWDTLAVIPWGNDGESESSDEAESAALLALFARALTTDDEKLLEDVRQKREHTLAFLRFAADASAEPLRALMAHAMRPPQAPGPKRP